jgi:hypothetical protein
MRTTLTIAAGLVFAVSPLAQASQDNPPATRYGIEIRPKKYPQGTPKEALTSVLAAIEENKIAYLLAHLADPEFVDKRVKDSHRGNFDEFVKETSTKIADNPSGVKELQQFLNSGEWQENGNSAAVKLKDFKDRQIFFRKIGNRWFMENKQKEESKK